jgi:prevent-host-death family protein
MKTLSVTEVARNFSVVVDAVERDQEEIVLVRNRRQVARLVPEAPRQDAMEVFGDLYRTLDEKAAKALSRGVIASQRRGWFRAEEPVGWLVDTSIWIAVERGAVSADIHASLDRSPYICRQ